MQRSKKMWDDKPMNFEVKPDCAGIVRGQGVAWLSIAPGGEKCMVTTLFLELAMGKCDFKVFWYYAVVHPIYNNEIWAYNILNSHFPNIPHGLAKSFDAR